MEKREITCINCPMGCLLDVEVEDGKVISVTGNTCPRGTIYAEKEVTSPTRIVTGTIAVFGGVDPVVAAKTEHDIPKEKIADIAEAMRQVYATAPIHIGDVLVENIAESGSNLVATHDVAAKA